MTLSPHQKPQKTYLGYEGLVVSEIRVVEQPLFEDIPVPVDRRLFCRGDTLNKAKVGKRVRKRESGSIEQFILIRKCSECSECSIMECSRMF